LFVFNRPEVDVLINVVFILLTARKEEFIEEFITDLLLLESDYFVVDGLV